MERGQRRMNKRILVISILAVFTIAAITFATAVSSNTTTAIAKKESPLFGIRTKLAIGEKLENLKENIKARFVGERLFFLPFQWLSDREGLSIRDRLGEKQETEGVISCQETHCGTPTKGCPETECWQDTCRESSTCWPGETCRIVTCLVVTQCASVYCCDQQLQYQ